MTATITQMRRPPLSRPCGAGTQPGVIGTPVCGRTPAALFPCGWRCPDCAPHNRWENP